MDEQSKTQRLQQFEGTFFALLEQLNQRMSDINTDQKLLKCLHAISASGRTKLQLLNVSEGIFEPCIEYLRMVLQVLEFTASKNTKGSHFRMLPLSYHLGGKSGREDEMYVDIVKAHLSGKALCLIGCYAAYLAEMKSDTRFKMLVISYNLLDNMPTIVLNGSDLPTRVKDYYLIDNS
ncbi:hypothetical protein EGJ27_21545 [Pseudomonas sp. v388]|nr:hypothetical protein EGJ27_21545 [Pseudomonas sp. v388]